MSTSSRDRIHDSNHHAHHHHQRFVCQSASMMDGMHAGITMSGSVTMTMLLMMLSTMEMYDIDKK